MEYRELGRGGLKVSLFGLGTMTWGSQNTPEEAFRQIDHALDRGVTLLDTAEMYPTTPLAAETSGDTERIIGQWLARTGRRSDVVLATKITGVGNQTVGRDGAPITPATLRLALEGSLRRLGTDHVDLYQLHWPNRGSYHFRQSWTWEPHAQPRDSADELLAILDTVDRFVAEGKVRAFGLSNESAWGTATLLRHAEAHGLPRVVAIQNEYNLLHRLFDLDLAELCHHEQVGLIAYSPLAAGFLTGKYRNGVRPAGTRGALNPNLSGRINPWSEPAVAAYLDVAARHGLDPAQMALAFCATRRFMGSLLVGATSMAQLENNLAAADLTLSQQVLDDIAAVRRSYPQTI
jgi:aryl-alcohol dehydrogenase-like predicted oxidoreductase